MWRRSLKAGGQKLRAEFVEAAGGLVVGGSSEGRAVDMKLAPDGKLLWTRRYREELAGAANAVLRSGGGGVIIGGSVYGPQDDALHWSRMDASGNEGRCPLFELAAGAARPVSLQPFALRFTVRPFYAVASELRMRYRNKQIDSTLCR